MRHPLPYAFAKAQQMLLEDDGDRLVLWLDPASLSLPALAEVQRLHGVDAVERETPERLAQRIAQAYAGGESSAAAVVG